MFYSHMELTVPAITTKDKSALLSTHSTNAV